MQTYDDYVVDPNTNQMYRGLPWVIFFYHEPCVLCKNFKAEYEKIASKNQDIARWGLGEGFYEEYLMETFDLKKYPTIVLIKNHTVYYYEGQRSEDLIVKFIQEDYKKAHLQRPLKARVGPYMLQMIYFMRRLPAINDFLDTYLFNYIGFSHLDVIQKLCMTVGFTLFIIGVYLM